MSTATPPAPLIETSTPLEKFLEANFKKLVLLAGAIALGSVVYGVVQYSARQNDITAGAAFASAKTVEDADLVISNFKGTVAAGNALLLKADLLWEANQKDSSVAALKEFIQSHTKHPLFPQVLTGLASKLESMGEKAEAKPLFERVISENPDTDIGALAQLRLGDLLWAEGKEAEAKTAYESIPVKFPAAGSTVKEESEGRLKWIAAKLPSKEVDGPPKPKVETPVTPTPGAPQIKLNSGGPTLSPTLMPQAPAAPSAPAVTPTIPTPAPALKVTPEAPPSLEVPAPMIKVEPAPAAPAATSAPVPAPTPAPAVPAPAAPAAPATAPIPPQPVVTPPAPAAPQQ